MPTILPFYTDTCSAISPSESVLYVVDMINGFCKSGALSDPGILAIVPAIADLCQQFLPEKIHFIADSHDETAIEFKAFPTHCLRGTAESEVVAELQHFVANPVIEKNSTNAFHQIIEHQSVFFDPAIKNVVITGCCTDICVLQFALTLKTYFNHKNWDKRVIVPADCVATYHNPALNHDSETFHSMALYLMQQAGIEVVNRVECV